MDTGSPWRRGVVVALLVVRVVILAGMVAAPFSVDANGADVRRAWTIGHEPGRPYVDFPVEYGPLTTVLDRALIGTSTVSDTERRLGAFNLLFDLVIVVALATWSVRAVVAYLVLSTPIMPFVYYRTDLLPVALLIAGVALAVRGRERLGGLAVALGFLAKLWPALAIPSLLFERRRAGLWALAATLVSTAAWLAWSPSGPWQVLSFRHATGWQMESTIGAALLLFGAHPRFEEGAWRVGGSLPLARPLLLLVLVVAFAMIWRARRDVVATTLAAIAVTLFVAPILSPQYVVWLLPLAAVGWARGETDVRIPLAISLLTGLVFLMLVTPVWSNAPRLLAVTVLIRNALLLPLAYDALRPNGGPTAIGRWLARAAGEGVGAHEAVAAATAR